MMLFIIGKGYDNGNLAFLIIEKNLKIIPMLPYIQNYVINLHFYFLTFFQTIFISPTLP